MAVDTTPIPRGIQEASSSVIDKMDDVWVYHGPTATVLRRTLVGVATVQALPSDPKHHTHHLKELEEGQVVIMGLKLKDTATALLDEQFELKQDKPPGYRVENIENYLLLWGLDKLEKYVEGVEPGKDDVVIVDSPPTTEKSYRGGDQHQDIRKGDTVNVCDPTSPGKILAVGLIEGFNVEEDDKKELHDRKVPPNSVILSGFTAYKGGKFNILLGPKVGENVGLQIVSTDVETLKAMTYTVPIPLSWCFFKGNFLQLMARKSKPSAPVSVSESILVRSGPEVKRNSSRPIVPPVVQSDSTTAVGKASEGPQESPPTSSFVDDDWSDHPSLKDNVLLQSNPTCMSPKYSSLYYKYFRFVKSSLGLTKDVPSGTAKVACLTCIKGGKFTTVGFALSSIRSHLQHGDDAHKQAFAEINKERGAGFEKFTFEAVKKENEKGLEAHVAAGGSLSTFVEIIPAKSVSVEQRRVIDELLVRWIGFKNIAPWVARHEELKAFIHALNPGYSLPCTTTIGKLLDGLENRLKMSMIASLKETINFHSIDGKVKPFLTLLWDGWSKGKNGTLGIAGVWFNPVRKVLNFAVLGLSKYEKRHTADDSRELVMDALTELNLNVNHIHRGVSDGAALAIGRALGVTTHYCLCHKLQVLVYHITSKLLYKKDPAFRELHDLLKKVERIILHFKYSTQAMGKLEELQKQVIANTTATGGEKLLKRPRSLPSNCGTRWNGILTSFRVLSHPVVSEAVRKYLLDPPDYVDKDTREQLKNEKKLYLTDSDFIHMKQVVMILERYEELTVFFQGESYVTSSYMVFYLEWLRAEMDPAQTDKMEWRDLVGNVRRSQVEDWGVILQNRSQHFLSIMLPSYDEATLIALVMHPGFLRLYDDYGRDDDDILCREIKKGKSLLEKVFDEYALDYISAEKQRSATAEVPAAATTPTIVPQVATSNSASKFSKMMTKSRTPSKGTSALPNEVNEKLTLPFYRKELTNYFNGMIKLPPPLNIDSPIDWKSFDVLSFWLSLCDTYPILCRIALRYLATPGASSFCERMFSGGGKVSAQASIETVEQKVVLRNNRHFLDTDPLGNPVAAQSIGSLTKPGTTILVFQAAQDTSDTGDAIEQEEEIQAFVELDDEGEEVEIEDQ